MNDGPGIGATPKSNVRGPAKQRKAGKDSGLELHRLLGLGRADDLAERGRHAVHCDLSEPQLAGGIEAPTQAGKRASH